MSDTAVEFLGGHQLGDSRWRFELGRELHGAFGGAFGGAVAAVSVVAGQAAAGERTPSGIDCRFLRGLPAGAATVTTDVVASGRTLTCVNVDVVGVDDRLATRALVTYVDGEALEPLDHAGDPAAVPPEVADHAAGRAWKEPPGVEIPILTTFDPRGVGRGDRGIATSIRVPWDDPTAAAAAACLAADMSVGPPVDVVLDRWIPHPNPDLTLRFAAPRPAPTLVGLGRLARIEAGLACVDIEVWSGDTLAAVGASTSLLQRQR